MIRSPEKKIKYFFLILWRYSYAIVDYTNFTNFLVYRNINPYKRFHFFGIAVFNCVRKNISDHGFQPYTIRIERYTRLYFQGNVYFMAEMQVIEVFNFLSQQFFNIDRMPLKRQFFISEKI